MRKLLFSLIAISTTSISLANYLPNGNYKGFLQQDGYNQDAAYGVILNDQVDIKIPTLTAIGATDGVLTGAIVQNDSNCIQNANFVAKMGFLPLSASSVVLTNCKFENNIFSGNYDAIVLGLVHNKGIFSFTYTN